MKSVLCWLPLFAGLVSVQGPAPSAPEVDGPGALARLMALEAAGDRAAGLALVDALLAEGRQDERLEAKLHYAHGLFLAPDEEVERARSASEAFSQARALAGPGDLRLASGYNGGTNLLHLAERKFAQLKEPQAAAPPMPAAPGVPGQAAQDPPPNPLEEARDLYLEAHGRLVERLRSDWRDVDTRANLELIQRRLDELQQMEEEQSQEQQQEEGDPGEDGEEGDESQDSEGDSESEPSQDGESEDEGEPNEGENEQEGEPEEQGEQEGEADSETESVPRPEGEAPEEQAAQGGQPTERHLTREEAMRLFDKLEEIDQKGQLLQQLLKQARRVKVEKDW